MSRHLAATAVALACAVAVDAADNELVVPATSGTVTQSHLLPRTDIPETRIGCPWEASGLIPFPGEGGTRGDVTLLSNTKYLLSDSTTVTGTLTIPEGAELIFADSTFELVAHSILNRGRFRIGSPTCRTSVSTQHIVTLTGSRSDSDPDEVGQKGIVVSGEEASIDIFGHLHQPSWSRLALTATAGANELILQECVEWTPGSKIVVTTTHIVDWRGHNENEEVEITAVTCEMMDYLSDARNSTQNFAVVSLSAPLQHSHYAGRGEYQAEVGLLSRNVVVRGAANDSPATDPQPPDTTCDSKYYSEVPCQGFYLTGYGGHVIVMGGASGRISAVEFHRMGQTNLIGRYPVHLHLLGAAGASSFVSDCSVHESYYRGIVVHGTSNALVTRNVAYDVVGHCFYLESGIEENNEFSFNLGAHIHTIGHFLNFKGQETDTSFTSADLGGAVIPADGAASAFYIPNLYNNFTGNAAVGGFSGFAMVTFPEVIGPWPPSMAENVDFSPRLRPTLPGGFNGNSARSTGYFWSHGACFYVGGLLEEEFPDGPLRYTPGRLLGPKARKPHLEDGTEAWLTFVNTKASLCNVGGEDWNVRSSWYNMDIVDIGSRTFNAFGDVLFKNIFVQCRSKNGMARSPPNSPGSSYSSWTRPGFTMFRAYDTGQRHILDNWQIQGCGTEDSPMATRFRDAQLWSLPHGVNVGQNQLAMRNISYPDGPPDPVKFISFDVGNTDTYSAFYTNFLDADGSLTRRVTTNTPCQPTIVGSAGMIRSVKINSKTELERTPPNMWFKLSGLDDGSPRGPATADSRCDLLEQAEFPHWVCDRGSISVASILVETNGRAQTTARTYEVWGGVAHFGDELEDGPPLPGDHQVTGPHDHSRRGGWFLQYNMAADDPSTWSSPKTLLIGKVQMEEGSVLMLSFAYPAGTTFSITRKVANAKNVPLVSYTEASSIKEVREDSAGSVYFFDGTYLYIRAQRAGMPWTGPLGFGEGGLWIPDVNPGWSVLTITATWAPNTGCGTDDWCRAATRNPPPATAGEIAGTTEALPCANIPTVAPSSAPSSFPSAAPMRPTSAPSFVPTVASTDSPSVTQTESPSDRPSYLPTTISSDVPSASPTSWINGQEDVDNGASNRPLSSVIPLIGPLLAVCYLLFS